ncbi:transcriptional regulator [candidate division KSB1 bacterium]|nr:transcriptional regulator [candidate division KSB1 bacterium]
MKNYIVLTLTGTDRIGLVDQITDIILKNKGNIEASKMARLGGEFAMLAFISVPENNKDHLSQKLLGLKTEGFLIVVKETGPGQTQKYHGWLPYKLDVHGADHEGIIHQIAHDLAQKGVNIESMDTGMIQAPMSGTPLFFMSAVVLVPPALIFQHLREGLERSSDEVNVNCELSPYKG